MESMDWSQAPFPCYQSEKLAAEALASDNERWITYKQTDQPYEVFEEWLSKNLPSCCCKYGLQKWVLRTMILPKHIFVPVFYPNTKYYYVIVLSML